ncbi:MAG: CPBP family intramembrane metalloprotease [Lachnospiraceae bacterium]|nr:CPBP family intramembrane metalloprotease [Lachnospiraceae bacterium]
MDTKACRKEFSRLGLKMLACAFIINGVQIAGQLLLAQWKIEWASNINIVLAFTMIPQYVIGFPCAFLVMSDMSDKRQIEKHKMKVWQLLLAFMMGYTLLMAGNLIGLGFTYGIGVLKGEPVSNALEEIVSGTNMWLTSIYTVLLAPVFEELLFRKVICDRMVKYGQGAAIILSGLMFGLFHGNFNQFFYAFFIGSFFAFIYVKTGNIKYTIILHMMVNFVGSVIGGLFLKYVDLENLTLVGMLIAVLYSVFIYGIVIVGFVLLLVNLSKLKVDVDYHPLMKRQRAKDMLINVGMILYSIFFLILMIVQALM